jgi:hypothetical protein
MAAQRLTVGLSAKSGRDLVPRPIGGAGFPHGHLERLLSDSSGVAGGLD